MTLARKVAITTVSLVVGRALAVLAGIGAIGLASRYLGLERFGALTLAMAIVALVALLTDLGLSTMAAREISRAPGREREILGNLLTLGLACAVGALGILIGVAEVAYASDPDVRRAIMVLSAQVATAPFLGAARAHFQAAQRGHLIAVGDVALAVAMLAGSLICVEADLGFTAMAAAVASGYVTQAVVLVALMRRDVRLAWVARGRVWRALLRTSLPLGATMVINYLYFRLDVLLLSLLRGSEAVAVYGLAYRVLEGLMVLPAYFMLALFPEIARLSAQRERVDAIVRAALRVMEVIGLPLVVLGVVFADEVVALIGGKEFGGAASVLRILMLALGISYLNGVYGNVLPALGRQKALLRWSAAVLGVNLVVNLALIPPIGVVGAGIAVVASEAVAFAVVRHLYGQVGVAPRLAPNPRMLLAGAVMVVAVAPKFLLPDGFASPLPTVMVGGAFGLLVYVASLIGMRAVPEAITAQLPGRLSRLGSHA